MVVTWLDACELLAESYPVVRTSNSDLTVDVDVDGKTVSIYCRHAIVDGSPWIVMSSEIAPCGRIRVAEAMYLNMEFTIGSLCIHRGVVFLRQSLPIAGSTASSLREGLEGIAEHIAYVRSHVERPEGGNPFSELVT